MYNEINGLDEQIPPKSTKNATRTNHHPGEKRFTNVVFVSNEEHIMKQEKEATVLWIFCPSLMLNLLIQQPLKSQPKKKTLAPVKLFEEYFVIGVDKKDVQAFELENPG